MTGPLTERELAILQRLAQGESNTQIAEALCLAEGTVKNYVSSIISKLQANDRTHAAVLALKRGLATLESAASPPGNSELTQHKWRQIDASRYGRRSMIS